MFSECVHMHKDHPVLRVDEWSFINRLNRKTNSFIGGAIKHVLTGGDESTLLNEAHC